MNPPILITGCARSGTSMTAGIISLCGAWGGNLAGSNRHNKRGMFENTSIRNDLIKPFLRRIKCDPMGQKILPSQEHLPQIIRYAEELRQGVESIISQQGLKGNKIWFYKGAKMCMIWQAWHLAFPHAKWVIVRRRDEDIIYSCLRTGFMRAFTNESGWQDWVNSHKLSFRQMNQAGLNIFEIWPQKMISGNFSESKQMIESLGLKWKEDQVRNFISPALWSERKKQHGGQGNK